MANIAPYEQETTRSILHPTLSIWLILAGVIVVDLVQSTKLGWSFVDIWRGSLPVASLAGVMIFYATSGRSPQLLRMANWLLLWVVFSLSGAILTYLVATRDGVLYDTMFSRFDAEFGFIWENWFRFVTAHGSLSLILGVAYISLMAQTVFAPIYFSYFRNDIRNCELIKSSIISLFITMVLFSYFPTLGPGAAVPAYTNSYVAILEGLRSGTLKIIDLGNLEGLITFPSFHSVMAILLTYAYRDTYLLIPVAVLNFIMLLAVPTLGGHYLTDVFAGAAIASIAIALTVPETPFRRRTSSAAI